ncbi:hypothetical protein [Pseudactinotalea sp.]|uniref:hypothetical protein n=1 Tax=Pseudactinotalea sp. TaxID=1926260 RepID=UPI003B3A1F19
MSGNNATAPRPRRKLLAALVAVGVLVIGCVVFWLVYTNWSGPTSEPTTPDEPIVITEGDPFVFNGLSYEASWELRALYGELTITDLVAENHGEEITYAEVVITLEQDSAAVATISCMGSGIKPGESTFLQCSSQDEVPTEFDRIVASADES